MVFIIWVWFVEFNDGAATTFDLVFQGLWEQITPSAGFCHHQFWGQSETDCGLFAGEFQGHWVHGFGFQMGRSTKTECALTCQQVITEPSSDTGPKDDTSGFDVGDSFDAKQLYQEEQSGNAILRN